MRSSTKKVCRVPAFTPARVATPPYYLCLPFMAMLLVAIPRVALVSLNMWVRSVRCYLLEGEIHLLSISEVWVPGESRCDRGVQFQCFP
ncbi:succinate dehydrogenase [ubiquinone] iron-sulfur subunit 3 [Pyrus ussuriensis x Pyrus communis]|uniref:Succinate dehydrogenase [ubiquinone] iron-sulfur subunit 3 n=1 Tax=Pyrus ussuriensis x Pyrus communis TaxID=2448454 RepID=A0A5N5I1I6_9ROSA|nr:succinate dehydrogenase [ubiquinone] iron-sulfur subunit 3 [Pyrus ussuriensis x Pyrus communis]